MGVLFKTFEAVDKVIIATNDDHDDAYGTLLGILLLN